MEGIVDQSPVSESPDTKALDENVDAAVFDQGADTGMLQEDTREAEFQVINPQNAGGHIVYTCKGSDSTGGWEGQRRYNEFFILHAKLQNRWPGIPIPSIPAKKAIGNKDLKFINERRFYLERFLKKMSGFDFMLESQEFKMFTRPQGNIEKSLEALTRLTPKQYVDRYQEALKIESHLYDPIQKDKLDNECKEFLAFSKQIKPILQNMVKQIAQYMSTKSQAIQDYKVYLQMLDKYEELNLSSYVDHADSKMVLACKDKKDENDKVMKENVKEMVDSLKNPYFNLYHWCKGEIYDIEAVTNAVNIIDTIKKRIAQNEAKKRSTQGDLDNITTGRKSVTTLFKNASDTGAMVSKIEITDREIESLQSLWDVVTIYLGEQIIPDFKKKKTAIYHKIIQQFNVMQINNAHQVASFWSQILSNPNIKHAAEDHS